MVQQDAVQGIKRYAQMTDVQEQHHKERLESALSWLEGELRAIRACLDTGGVLYADNVVAQAGRVQEAAIQYRLAGERRFVLEDMLSATVDTEASK